MPVLITHPETSLAGAVGRALLDDGAEVRTFGPAPAPGLRAAGAFHARGDHDDVGRLEAALTGVHTLLLIGPGLQADPATWTRTGRGAVDAAERAGVARLLLCSLPGASVVADDPVRRAAGTLEDRLASAGPPSLVVRAGLVDTGPTRDAIAALGAVPDEIVVAPVGLADLAAGLVALDAARSQATSGHAVFTAVGPQELTLGAWLERVGVRSGGATDFVGRVYRPGGAALRQALAGRWTLDADERALPSLWDFASLRPAPPPRPAR